MTFPELDLYAEQLNAIPETIGQWQGEDLGQSDEKVKKISGAVGELMRTYRNPAGEEVRVSIICARQRDIFYHTPERCYPAAGFDMQGEPQQEVFEIGNTTAEFFTTSFLKSEPTGTHAERGYWSWTGDGKWIAPRNPKLEFAGHRALYKLYVFATIPPGNKGKQTTDFCERLHSRVRAGRRAGPEAGHGKGGPHSQGRRSGRAGRVRCRADCSARKIHQQQKPAPRRVGFFVAASDRDTA